MMLSGHVVLQRSSRKNGDFGDLAAKRTWLGTYRKPDFSGSPATRRSNSFVLVGSAGGAQNTPPGRPEFQSFVDRLSWTDRS
jgi:hypothetical protein